MYTNTGLLINPEQVNSVSRMAPWGNAEGRLMLDEGFAYRTINPREVQSIYNEGVMITDPALIGKKSKARAQTSTKMFSIKNQEYPRVGYFPENTVLRVPIDKLNLNKMGVPVNASDVDVLTVENGQWTPKKVHEFLGKTPKSSGPNRMWPVFNTSLGQNIRNVGTEISYAGKVVGGAVAPFARRSIGLAGLLTEAPENYVSLKDRIEKQERNNANANWYDSGDAVYSYVPRTLNLSDKLKIAGEASAKSILSGITFGATSSGTGKDRPTRSLDQIGQTRGGGQFGADEDRRALIDKSKKWIPE
jgi:hypothetical protein